MAQLCDFWTLHTTLQTTSVRNHRPGKTRNKHKLGNRLLVRGLKTAKSPNSCTVSGSLTKRPAADLQDLAAAGLFLFPNSTRYEIAVFLLNNAGFAGGPPAGSASQQGFQHRAAAASAA